MSDDAESCNGINCTQLAGCDNKNEVNCYCNDDNLCEATKCEAGYHIKNENGVPCVADTDTACGIQEINCTDSNLWKNKSIGSKICYNEENSDADAYCKIDSCAEGYHFNQNRDACEEDSIEACGSYNNDCRMLAGWRKGECTKGQCQATECSDNYHIYNITINGKNTPCEIDSILNCGDINKPCELSVFPGAGSVKCENHECRIDLCALNYHKKEITVFETDTSGTTQSECVADDKTVCGSEQFSCLNNTAVADARCIGPYQCEATQCESGFHVYNGICEKDDSSNCGSHDNPCNNGQFCKSDSGVGQCINSNDCNQTTCGGDCVDTKNNIAHCGGCNHNCQTDYPNASVKCDKGSCILQSCNLGYHLSKDKRSCVKDSATECGKDLINCTDSKHQLGNAIMDCQYGECTFTCQRDYGNCDSSDRNGCETYLDNYGLTVNEFNQCVCSNDYLSCGKYTDNGIEYPLCLKQGHYYINYMNPNSSDTTICTNNSWDWAFMENTDTVYCLDKCHYWCSDSSGLLTVNFGQEHKYRQDSVEWNNDIYEWNTPHCIQACNTGNEIWGTYFQSNNSIDSWSHTCRPKQECDMFDSVQKDGQYGNRYIDYGCKY